MTNDLYCTKCTLVNARFLKTDIKVVYQHLWAYQWKNF